ncbi:hypothetical protein L1889_00375 [Paenalcaligenes niemegkensis]|uniref:hypothetical protein n=1 Tax=Paenalcaligenes niemegkensis TaxID=2895469 RepID=UPI001EE9A5F2|nr:hypothetical protein [Paenalcaligenes niemegkensis]MCQ9615363.1 hypothetical protein [Paenalcaligenes niemegkensis]
MATRRSTRWNGELGSLAPEFLKDVVERMESYGDRVQFQFPGHAKRPNYQVLNARGFKMAFDSKNLLMPLNENGNVSDDLSKEFSLDAVKQAISAPPPVKRAPRSSTGGATRSRAAARPAVDPIEVEKYNYFKGHREFLPNGIQEYSAQISELMQSGMSAEEAFNQIVETHFD